MRVAVPRSRSLATGTLLISAARAANVVGNALVSVIVARVLGPGGAGTCAVALVLYAVLLNLGNLGIGLGAAWQISAGTWSPRSALLSTQAASVAIGVAAAGAGLAAFALARDSVFGGLPALGAVLVVVSIPFALAWMNAAQVAIAAEHYEVGFWLPVVQSVGYVLGVAVFALIAGVEGALAGLLISQVPAAASTAWWARRALPRARGRGGIDVARLRRAVTFGAMPWLGQLLTLVVQRADILVLSATASQAAVGRYAVAVALTAPLLILPTGLGAVLFPRVASLTATTDAAEQERVESRALRHGLLLLVVGAVAVALVAVFLLPVLYGRAFEDALVPALVLLPGTIVLGLVQVARAALAGRGHPRYVLVTWIAVLPVAGLAYGLLIPAYGAVGAALASSLAYGVAGVVSGVFLARASDRPTYRRLIPGRAELGDYRRALLELWALVRRRRPRAPTA